MLLPLAELVVPSNASRFYLNRDEALAQPTGRVRLAWRREDPYLVNAAFDADLVDYGDAYCTTVTDLDQVAQVPTLDYLFDAVLPRLPAGPLIADIGCGQGEFVTALRRAGARATGYDPVLRVEGPGLHARRWTPTEPPADLYVMRCVLPHIDQPWTFLGGLAAAAPGALVLIEFQRLEWILEHQVWYQVSHDHVNTFSIEDFRARYPGAVHGTFRHGEWAWVLVDPTTYQPPRPRDCPVVAELDTLWAARGRLLDWAADRRVVPWGAAGKGIVLAHALVAAGREVPLAIDADPHRWGRFMETSGVAIVGPEDPAAARDDVTVVVANPNHYPEVVGRYGDRWDLTTVPALRGSR